MEQMVVAPECYLNHAGCSFVTQRTFDAVVAQMERERRLGMPRADHASAAEKQRLYELAAVVVGAQAADMAMTDGHTSGWTKALQTIRLSEGDVLLTTRSEWGGNLKFLRHWAHRYGATVDLLASTPDGAVCLDSLRKRMSDKVKLISVSWLGSNGGHLEPAAAIGEIARSYGAPYFLDASQVLGQMQVDVQSLHCDVLTAPGRKWLRGPKGTGLMYVRPEFLADVQAQGAFDSLLDNTSAVTAKHFEGSAASASLQMGLKAALEQLQEVGIETVQQGIVANSRRLWEGLQDLPGIECLSKVPPLHGIVSFSQEGTTAADVKSHLMREGVEVVVNQAAYTPLDMQARQFDAVVRASPHSCSTSDEVENLIRVMSLMVKASGRSLA